MIITLMVMAVFFKVFIQNEACLSKPAVTEDVKKCVNIFTQNQQNVNKYSDPGTEVCK